MNGTRGRFQKCGRIEFSVGFAETEMPGGVPGFVFISVET